jgi:hypothetical protein
MSGTNYEVPHAHNIHNKLKTLEIIDWEPANCEAFNYEPFFIPNFAPSRLEVFIFQI